MNIQIETCHTYCGDCRDIAKVFNLTEQQSTELTNEYKSNSQVKSIEEYLNFISRNETYKIKQIGFDKGDFVEEFVIVRIEK